MTLHFQSESFQRLPKISAGLPKSFRKCSVSFRFFPKISLGNLYLSKLYVQIGRRTGRKFLPAAGAACSRAVNQHLGIGLPSIRKPNGCEGGDLPRKSGRVRGERTRTFSVAASRTYREHNLELLSRDCSAHAAGQRRPDVLEQRPPTRSCQLVFVDETGASTNLARRHGTLPARTATGGRCPARATRRRSPSTPVSRLRGLAAPKAYDRLRRLRL